jgi:hypothetical protein
MLSNNETVEPNRANPNTDNADPTLVKLLKDMDDPN